MHTLYLFKYRSLCSETKRRCRRFKYLVFSIHVPTLGFLNATQIILLKTNIFESIVCQSKELCVLKLWWILKAKLFAILVLILDYYLGLLNLYEYFLRKTTMNTWGCQCAICPMLIITKIIHQRHSVILVFKLRTLLV